MKHFLPMLSTLLGNRIFYFDGIVLKKGYKKHGYFLYALIHMLPVTSIQIPVRLNCAKN